MKYISENELKRFELRDRDWELVSWSEDAFSVRVKEPDILTGEYAGKRIARALVTFRGVRPEEALTHDGQKEYSLTHREAMERFSRFPMFVFSYYPGEQSCELCGLGPEDPLALIFGYDSVMVEWDGSAIQ